LNGLKIDDEVNWMIMGDFNFYRSLQDRNREGGNMHDIIVFNEMISNLGLQEFHSKVEILLGAICNKIPS
jgi:hypothetical protein